jgi:hypothetical protein
MRLRLSLILLALSAPFARAADPATLSFAKDVQPLLATYCGNCHGADAHKGDVSLAPFKDDSAVDADPRLWRNVLTQIADYTMPPKSKRQPTMPERERLINYLTHRLNNLDLSKIAKDPGRVTIRRLNRQEYNNTLRDLLGVYTRPADAFPADGGGGGGFDNNADTLFLPPVLMELYLKAAGDAILAADRRMVFSTRLDEAGLAPREVAKRNIERLATRAFRRPLGGGELDRLLILYDRATKEGKPLDVAIKLAYKAILVSPHFLFRIETDQNATEPYAVNDYELASRLSYFLWASMPDDELFRLANEGKLRDEATIDAQVRRMLKDKKAKALSEYFGMQWLGVTALNTTANPDRKKFPEYTPALKDTLFDQAVAFVDSVFREDRPLTTLIDSDYTYVNRDLAKHYGFPRLKVPDKEDDLRHYPLPPELRARGGVLGLGAIHAVTSYPLRTSPVLRGKWVLETVIGAPPPPPPPDVPTLPEDDAPAAGLTFRQRLEKHRSDANCASCHNRMDPIGFGLENFDPIGRWRTTVANEPVDAVGQLTTGETFKGPAELKAILLKKKDAFARALAQRMLAYALGRGLEPYDEPALAAITAAVAKDGDKSHTLVAAIAKSYPFRYRRAG